MKKLFLSVAALFAVCIVSAQEGVVASYNKGAEMLQSKNYPEAAKLFQKVIDEGMASEDATELNCVETAKKYLPTCYQGWEPVRPRRAITTRRSPICRKRPRSPNSTAMWLR